MKDGEDDGILRDGGFTSSWGRSWRCLRQPILRELPDQYCISLFRTTGHTRGQALPQLFSLLRVLEGQGVQVPGASDLELGHRLGRAHGGDLLGGETGGRVGVDSDGGLLYSSGYGRRQGLVRVARLSVVRSIPLRPDVGPDVSCVSSRPPSDRSIRA